MKSGFRFSFALLLSLGITRVQAQTHFISTANVADKPESTEKPETAGQGPEQQGPIKAVPQTGRKPKPQRVEEGTDVPDVNTSARDNSPERDNGSSARDDGSSARGDKSSARDNGSSARGDRPERSARGGRGGRDSDGARGGGARGGAREGRGADAGGRGKGGGGGRGRKN